MERIRISVRSSILVLVFSILMSPMAFAQQEKVSVNVKNVTLEEFFKAIEGQTDYSFSFRDSELDGKPLVTVKAKDVSLATLLNAELAKADLQYALVNDKIVITPLPASKAAAEELVAGR